MYWTSLKALSKRILIEAIPLIPIPVVIVLFFALGLIATVFNGYLGYSSKEKK